MNEFTDNLDEIVLGRRSNVFLNGPGGTGKSTQMKRLLAEAEQQSLVCYMTGTTGVSALNVGGTTIHRLLGLGTGERSVQQLYSRITDNPATRRIWTGVDILFVDEISMMPESLFAKINKLGQHIRRETKPFGGIQLVLAGDFLQLPPVGDFCVLGCDSWMDAKFETVTFRTGYRYPSTSFFRMLKRIRKGRQTEKDIARLQARVDAFRNGEHLDLAIQPTVIHPTKKSVNSVNGSELAKLPGKQRVFLAKDSFPVECPPAARNAIRESFDKNIPQRLVLKANAQVMLTFNVSVEDGLVNGSRGVVEGFSNAGVVVRFRNGTTTIDPVSWEEAGEHAATREQIPLILAYSCTCHKVQGATLDSCVINLGNTIFEEHQFYVTLSRCRSLDNVYITSLDPSKIMVNEGVRDFLSNL